MTPQTYPGQCHSRSGQITSIISSIEIAVQVPDASLQNWSSTDCDEFPQCAAGSNTFTDTGPTELSKTYTRNQSGPYFTLTKNCCSKCGFSLAFYDFTAGEKDGNGNPLNIPGLTFAGESYIAYDYPDGNLQNPDGSYICPNQQPASGTNTVAYSSAANLAFDFYLDDSGSCVFDLGVLFGEWDGAIGTWNFGSTWGGGGLVRAIPFADLFGTHTLTYSATVNNPQGACSLTPESYSYVETYTITIS